MHRFRSTLEKHGFRGTLKMHGFGGTLKMHGFGSTLEMHGFTCTLKKHGFRGTLEKHGFQHSAWAARNIRSATLPAHGGESHLNPIENHWYSLCFPMPPVVKAACPWNPLLRPTQNLTVY